jgi:prevent-host-death family protein
VIDIFTTHIKSARDLKNSYPDVSRIINNRDHVIITNNGKNEAVIIPFEELKSYEEYLHIRYVKEKLKEAERIADNPGEWMELSDLFEQWNEWEAAAL